MNYDDLEYTQKCLYVFRGEIFSELAQEFHENGSVASEIVFLQGKQHGFARAFAANGQLKCEVNYLSGLRHGPKQTWHENGNIQEQSQFLFDVLMESKEWSADGALLKEYKREEDDHLYKLVMKRLDSESAS